jgi:hypothetical protein
MRCVRDNIHYDSVRKTHYWSDTMGKVCFVCAGLLGLGMLVPAICADDGKEFNPKNGKFTITFPPAQKTGSRQQVVSLGGAAPSASARRAPRGRGQVSNRMPIETSYAVLKDGTKFNAGSAGIPAALLRDIPLDKRFDTFSDSFIKSLNGKSSEESDIKQGSIPGKRYQIEGGNGAIRMDLYMNAGWIMFALVDAKTKDDLDSKEAKAFFDSFKLTQPENKDDPKKDKDTDK